MSAKKTTLRILSSLKSIIDDDFSCPICSQPCTDTLINPACGHRFCGTCIKAQGEDNLDCPTCGVHIATCQSCSADLHFDRIVSPYTAFSIFSLLTLGVQYATANERNIIISPSPSKFNRIRIAAEKNSDGVCFSVRESTK
jgi:hypothetical protein